MQTVIVQEEVHPVRGPHGKGIIVRVDRPTVNNLALDARSDNALHLVYD